MPYRIFRDYVPGGPDAAEIRRQRTYRGRTALVLGSGPSMQECADTVERTVTIGVNTVSTKVPCDFLLLGDHPNTFKDKRDAVVAGEHQSAVITAQFDEAWRALIPDAIAVLGIPIYHETQVPDAWDFFRHGWVPLFNGLPYAAAAFASYIGCTTIILGGVDYTGDHHWSKPENFPQADEAFYGLRMRIEMEGGRIWNASKVSRLTRIERWPTT